MQGDGFAKGRVIVVGDVGAEAKDALEGEGLEVLCVHISNQVQRHALIDLGDPVGKVENFSHVDPAKPPVVSDLQLLKDWDLADVLAVGLGRVIDTAVTAAKFVLGAIDTSDHSLLGVGSEHEADLLHVAS